MLTTKRRVTRLAVISLVVMVLGYVGFSYSIVHGVLLHEVDEVSERLAVPLRDALTRPRTDPAELAVLLRDYPLWPGEHISVRDPEGRILGARGSTTLLPSPLGVGAAEIDGDPPYRLIVTPVTVDDKLRGTIVQLRQLEDFWHTLEHIVMGFVALLPLTLLLAVLLAIWIAQLSTRPIEAALFREQQFSRDASHELRTPLSLILANTQLLLQRADLTSDVRDKLELIEGRARRIKAVLQDLLTLGRGDGGHGDSLLRFSLCELLEEEVGQVSSMAAERDIEVSLAELPSDVQVVGSPHGLAQALRNLLENAIHYSPSGATVSVRLEAIQKQARVVISNPGPGIAPEDQVRVFERFVRLDHAQEAYPDGSGLGLAIARAIAKAHRGDLTLASHPNQGATFMLALPLA